MSRELLKRALSKLLVLSNTDIRNQETDELIEEIERFLSRPSPKSVPGVAEHLEIEGFEQ
jgi:hypothetical protein